MYNRPILDTTNYQERVLRNLTTRQGDDRKLPAIQESESKIKGNEFEEQIAELNDKILEEKLIESKLEYDALYPEQLTPGNNYTNDASVIEARFAADMSKLDASRRQDFLMLADILKSRDNQNDKDTSRDKTHKKKYKPTSKKKSKRDVDPDDSDSSTSSSRSSKRTPSVTSSMSSSDSSSDTSDNASVQDISMRKMIS